MKENIMSEEAFYELINGLEVVERLTMYGRKNIKYHVKKLQQENKKLNGAIQTYDILLKSNVEENKQLKEQLLVSQTNEETFRLEMEDITKILGLDENTLFDDVKVCVKSLKDNWNKLKEWIDKHYDYYMNNVDYIGGRLCFTDIKNKMQELEKRK